MLTIRTAAGTQRGWTRTLGRKVVEIKTKANAKGMKELTGKLKPHVQLQTVLHMLVTRVPVVDVVYFTQPTEPVMRRYMLHWSEKLQQKFLKRDLPQAIEQYKKLWLPRFRAHRAGAAGRALTGVKGRAQQ